VLAADERRLPGTGGPEDHHHLALADGRGDALQRLEVPEPLLDVLAHDDLVAHLAGVLGACVGAGHRAPIVLCQRCPTPSARSSCWLSRDITKATVQKRNATNSSTSACRPKNSRCVIAACAAPTASVSAMIATSDVSFHSVI